MKFKLDAINFGLIELSSGMENYNALSVIKKNIQLFRHVFTPSQIFVWDWDLLYATLDPKFSDDGTNQKKKEVDLFKIFLDFLETCFLDGICLFVY